MGANTAVPSAAPSCMLCAFESGGDFPVDFSSCFDTARWQIGALTRNGSQHTPDGMVYNCHSPVACARRELDRGREPEGYF